MENLVRSKISFAGRMSIAKETLLTRGDVTLVLLFNDLFCLPRIRSMQGLQGLSVHTFKYTSQGALKVWKESRWAMLS